MSGNPVIAIFAQNDAQLRYLSDIVRLAGAEPLVAGKTGPNPKILLATENGYPVYQGQTVFYLGSEASLNNDAQTILMPIKAAALVEQIEKTLTRQSAPPEKITMGDAELDTRENLWLRQGCEAVRLTDRESEILLFLYKAGGHAVNREALLQHVWAYASNVQTHTLETHIYRLRQKIEHDPSNPKILLTQEDGYSLAKL